MLFIVMAMLFCLNSIVVKADDSKDGKKLKSLFVNQEKLDSIFEKLYQLEQSKNDKINIVHLGDSHIQADFFTNAIRMPLQDRFGDGGLGFSFPYSLARTNGTRAVKFVSDANWESKLNVSPKASTENIGLSGIGLTTSDTLFALQLSTVDRPFNSIKVFYSTVEPQYNLSLTANDSIKYVESNLKPKSTTHRIKSGESLSTIARRYKTTIAALKRENNLRSDRIQAGKILRIPSKGGTKTVRKAIRGKFDYLAIDSSNYNSYYHSPDPLNKITLLPKSGFKTYDLSGFILENDNPGILYHTIGVNGAKLSDFNKLPLFFEQMDVINPDMVVLSFGTNESFQKLEPEQFIYNIRELVSRIRRHNPKVTFLITTPPPSLMRRRNSNPLLVQYNKILNELTDLPVWDLYSRMDGEKGIRVKGKYAGIIARDKIHYTQDGYQQQGEMLANDFLNAYELYKKEKEKH